MSNNNAPSIESQIEFYNNYWKDLKPFGNYKIQRVNEILKQLNQITKKNKNPKILDFGCGDGRSVPIWGLIGETHGFDLSETAMKKASEIFPTFNFKFGDACHSEYNSEFYDIIISQEVIEHIIDQEKYFDECFKLLKKGGYLILTTPNKFYFDRVEGGNYSRQPIENIIDANQLSTLISKKFNKISFYSIINAKGDFGIYKLFNNIFVKMILKVLGIKNWFNGMKERNFYNLNLIIVAQKK